MPEIRGLMLRCNRWRARMTHVFYTTIVSVEPASAGYPVAPATSVAPAPRTLNLVRARPSAAADRPSDEAGRASCNALG